MPIRLVLLAIGLLAVIRPASAQSAAVEQVTDGKATKAAVDPAKREEFLRRARSIDERGSAFSQYMIGVYYLQGTEIEQDTAEAVRWFRKGALMGDHASQLCMVHAYRSGEGVSEDKVEALAWSIVSDGPGGDKDREATRALKRSMTPEQVRRARERSEELVRSVAEGEKIARKRFDLTQKEIAAQDLKVYAPLAEQGIATAQTQIGIIHSRGLGVVPVDCVEACAWWTLAAEGGDKDADRYLRDARQKLTREALDRLAVRAESLRSQLAGKKKVAP